MYVFSEEFFMPEYSPHAFAIKSFLPKYQKNNYMYLLNYDIAVAVMVHSNNVKKLSKFTLKALITTAADDIHKYFFIVFLLGTGFT